MEGFITIVIVAVVFWIIIRHIIKENNEERTRQYHAMEEERLRKEYPDGFSYYKNCGDKPYCGISKFRRTDEMISLKTEIINKQKQINAARRKAAEEDDLLVERQKKFSSDCLTAAKTYCQGFGWYLYFIPWEKRNLNGSRSKSELSVWQVFVDSLCLEQDLDYSLFPLYKANFDNLSEFKGMTRFWKSHIYETINSFIGELAKRYTLGIVFDKSINGWSDEAVSFHCKNISRDIPNTQILDSEFNCYPLVRNIKTTCDVNFLLIVSCFTENSSLKNRCENIFSKIANPPCVVYLSLLKCYDRNEMQELIKKEQVKYEEKLKQLKQEEEERLRKEKEELIDKTFTRIKELYPFGTEYFEKFESRYGLSQKELIVENEKEVAKYDIIYSQYLALQKKYPRGLPEFERMTSWDDGKNYAGLTIEDIIQFEDNIREIEQDLLNKELQLQKEHQDILLSKVKDWDLIQGCLHYTYLLNYFPVTCNFEANKREWEDRWTVWNFKNTPGKTSEEDHQEALEEVIPRIKEILVNTFQDINLQYLTLVCIPASTAEKTFGRYKEFSERLCNITGMINAYDYITVIKDSEEKKFGGSGITTVNVSFNEDFFKAKNVLLFDDIITKGESMLRFMRKIESLGANVIGGVSIGKTKHEREQSKSIDDIIDDLYMDLPL